MKKLVKISLMLSLTTLILPSLVQASEEERAIVPKKGASVAPSGETRRIIRRNPVPTSSAVVYSTEGREKGTPSRGTRSIALASGDVVHGVGVATSDRTPVRASSDPIPPKEAMNPRGHGENTFIFESIADAQNAAMRLPRLSGEYQYTAALVYSFGYDGETLSVKGKMPSLDGTGTACIFSEEDLNKNGEIYAQPVGSFPLVMIQTGTNQGALYAYVKPFAGVYRGSAIPMDGLLPYAYFGGANEGSMRNAREAFSDRMEADGGLLLPDAGIDRDRVHETTALWTSDSAAYVGLGENRPPFLIGEKPIFLTGHENRVAVANGDLAGLTFPVFKGSASQEIPGLIVPTEVQTAFGNSNHSVDILSVDHDGRVTEVLNSDALRIITDQLDGLLTLSDRQGALEGFSFSAVPLLWETTAKGYKLVARNDLIPAYAPEFSGKTLSGVTRAFVTVKGIAGSGHELSSPEMLAYLRNQGTHFLLGGGEPYDPRTDLYYSLEGTHTSYTKTLSGEMKASRVDIVPMTYGITSEAANAQRALLNSPTVRVALKSAGVDLTKQLVRDARVIRILTGDVGEVERSLNRMALGQGSEAEVQALKTLAKRGDEIMAKASSSEGVALLESASQGHVAPRRIVRRVAAPTPEVKALPSPSDVSEQKPVRKIVRKEVKAILPPVEVTSSAPSDIVAQQVAPRKIVRKTVPTTTTTPKFSGGREAFDGFIRAENQEPEFLNGDGQYVWKIPQHLINPELRVAIADQIKDGYFTIIGGYSDIEAAFEELGVN